jgi:hypothetical protein
VSKDGMKIHAWTTFDDAALEQAVQECEPLFRFYAAKRQNKEYGEGNAWDAVAGRLVPNVIVTGSACKRRFEVLQERRKEVNAASTDGWADAIQAVQEYEENALDRIESMVERVEAAVLTICSELGVKAGR